MNALGNENCCMLSTTVKVFGLFLLGILKHTEFVTVIGTPLKAKRTISIYFNNYFEYDEIRTQECQGSPVHEADDIHVTVLLLKNNYPDLPHSQGAIKFATHTLPLLYYDRVTAVNT